VLKTRLRWLGLIPRAWSQTRIEARPGRTLFVRIWAQYEAQDPGPAAATVPGRAEGKADVVIFAAPWDAAKAMPELAQTRRAPGP
jgi:hypothetical protein